MEQNLRLETSYNNKFRLIAGVDEDGRGAIAGPLVIAGVILPVNFDDYIIRDSKKLSSLQREKALKIIKKNAIELVVVIKSVTEVENKNPLEATREGMKEILSNFKHKPDICLIDGKEKVTLEGFNTLSVIAGDSKSINIAAASIVAKVTRDRIMRDLAKIYPVYN
jgi:ribonuclease HII